MEPESPRQPAPAGIMKKAVIALTTIFVVTFALFFVSLLLQGNASSIITNPVHWFNELDSSIAFDIVSTSAELLAAVLAIAITVVAIVVELAANRYSHRITSLFVREPVNIAVMCFFVIATTYSIWIALTLDATVEEATILNAGLMISLIMVTASLIILLPYFAFVMSFLSPVNIITKIRSSAIKAIERANVNPVEECQQKFLNAIDELQDIARRSVELSDRAVELASVSALMDLTLDYQKMIEKLRAESSKWLQISDIVINDPDFISVNNVSLEHINSEQLWVEVKILRQYLDLISDSNPSSRDTSYLIAINTRKIAVESIGSRPQLELVRLCMRCFNSYLRATINNKDARTGYYIMNQYRLLAEELLARGENRAVQEIATHFQFYGILGYQFGLPFLLEVAAEDVALLAGNCSRNNTVLMDDLIELLLELDQEIKEESEESSLLGVRRAHLKLAALLLDRGDRERAGKICDDLKDEKPERIYRLIELLETEDRKDYWEFTDRGVNFAYIEPKLREQLGELRKIIEG